MHECVILVILKRPCNSYDIQGDTAEEMNSWIKEINGIAHRGRSCSEPVRMSFCFALCLKSMGRNCLLLLFIFSFTSNLKSVSSFVLFNVCKLLDGSVIRSDQRKYLLACLLDLINLLSRYNPTVTVALFIHG